MSSRPVLAVFVPLVVVVTTVVGLATSASATTSQCVEVDGPNGNPHITTVCVPLP